MIGATTSKTLDLTLLNSGDTVYSTSTIKVEIGLKIDPEIEYIPMGVYNIDEIEKTDYTIKITAFDNMVKFETPYFSNLGDTPTLLQVVNELASITGVQFTGNLPYYKVKKLEGFTCREVLGYVASICGGNAIITRDGKFTIVTPEDIEYNIDPNHYFDYKREDTKYKIGKISCKAGEEVLSKGSLGTDSMELQFENPWVTNSILQDIYNKINGFEYLGYSMKWQGDLSLDLGDIVTITDKKGVTRKHPILSQKFIYTGGLTSEIGAKGETKNKNSFSSSGNTSQKVERIVTELLLINDALINKATIQDLEAVSIKTQTLETKTAQIEDAIIGVAYVEDLAVINASISNLQANKANISDLAVINGSIDSLKTNKADVIELNAVTGRIGNLESDVANIGTILSKDVFSELATVGKIVAGSQIIAEGAIGSAQISDLNASKLSAGIADLSKVTIQGTNGRLKIANNKLQVFDGTSDLFERVVLGDVNGDGSVYGLRIRGADGTTILFDENGQTKEGFTDGYNKLDDNSLNPRKLDIAQVVTRINEGTTTIQGSKISVDDGTLDVKFSTLKNTVNSHGESISTHSSQISALDNAIKLKVDTQTYNTKMTNLDNSISVINTNLNKATSDISILQGEITSKVSQTDINNSINAITIGGRNLLLGSQKWADESFYAKSRPSDGAIYDDTQDFSVVTVPSGSTRVNLMGVPVKGGESITVSIDVMYEDYDSAQRNLLISQYFVNNVRDSYTWEFFTNVNFVSGQWYRISFTRVMPKDCVYVLGLRTGNSSNSVSFRKCKIEIGNKATDWTPAPEDIQNQLDSQSTRISTAESSITQLTNSISLKVDSSTFNSYKSTTDSAISSLSSRVNAAELKITDSAIVSTVRNSTAYKNDLSGKVGTNEIISKINQTAESITIQANKIGLLGEANIPNLTADKIRGGTLTLGGGPIGQNGEQTVYDSEGNLILKIDKDGLRAYSGAISTSDDRTYVNEKDINIVSSKCTLYGSAFVAEYKNINSSGQYFASSAKLDAASSELFLENKGSEFRIKQTGFGTVFIDISHDLILSTEDILDFIHVNVNPSVVKVRGNIEVYGDAVVNQNITARGISIKVGTENHEIWHNGNCFASPQTTGFQELESGVIIQWGTVNNTNGVNGVQVSFPKTFKSVFSVVATPVDTDLSNNNTNAWVTGLNNYNFYLRTSRNSNVRWIAVGIVE